MKLVMESGLSADGGSDQRRVRRMGAKGRAFTLIEIMIAITIFAIVLAGIYSSWTAILRSSKVGLDAAAEAQRTRMTLRALDEALGSAQLFLGNIQYYWFAADTSGEFADLNFVSHLPGSFPGSGLFGQQAIRRVRFFVEENKLVLQQTPLLEWNDEGVKPYTIVLAPDVRMFNLLFFDTTQLEWVEEWPLTNQLPKVVKISLSFGDGKSGSLRPEEVSTETVYLAAAAVSPQLQRPSVRGRLAAPPPLQQPLAPQSIAP